MFLLAHVHGCHGLPAGLVEGEEGVGHQLDHAVPPCHLQSVGIGEVAVPTLLHDLTVTPDDPRQKLQLTLLSIYHLHPVRALEGQHEVACARLRLAPPLGPAAQIIVDLRNKNNYLLLEQN